MTQVALVIVSWNTRDLLEACLRSVVTDPVVAQIVVVDNASHDGSASMVHHHFPQVQCMAESVNHGFAGGNNIGLRWLLAQPTLPDYICCLNPDTVVAPGALARMVQFLVAHPTVVGCGPQLRYGDGRWQSSRRRFPTLGTYLCESTPIGQRWPQNPWHTAYHMTTTPTDATCMVDWLVGAVLMVRSATVRMHGLFDAGFALYSEEIEWQRRLAAGQAQRIAYVAEACVTHYEGQSSQQIPAQRLVWFFQSRLREATAAYGAGTARIVRYGLLVQYGAEWILEASKWVLGHKRALRHARMQGYAQLLGALWQWRMTPAQIW
ncbi:MAG: glycosyltransferase family 2 protein [Roseiflexaceae bacterium]